MLKSMTNREDIAKRSEKIWILCLDDSFLSKPLPPLAESIDWYQNMIVTKSLLKKKMTLEFGEKTLIASAETLSAEKVLVWGLGSADSLTGPQAKKFLKLLSPTLSQLQYENPWIILPAGTPEVFSDEIQKSKSTFDQLAKASVSVG